MSDRDAAAKLAIDTPDAELRADVERTLPGEPFAIDVAFRAVTLERVGLERERGETIVDWIRDAVDHWLATVERGERPAVDRLSRGRPDDYTPVHDTPDEEIVGAVLVDPPSEWVGVTIELPAGVLERAADVSDHSEGGERTSIAEWIRRAVGLRFALIDHELEIQPSVQVDVPPPIAERAKLKAQYAVIRDPSREYHEALRDALLDYVQPDPEYLVDGEPLDEQ